MYRSGIARRAFQAEQVAPEHLDDLRSSEQILERLEGAVREEGAAYEHALDGPAA